MPRGFLGDLFPDQAFPTSTRERRAAWEGAPYTLLASGVAADSGPVREGFQAAAIFPGKLEKFMGIEVGRFFAEKGLKTPLDVGTFPRLEAVAARGEPIEGEKIPHNQV
jgi:hypothetical protein